MAALSVFPPVFKPLCDLADIETPLADENT